MAQMDMLKGLSDQSLAQEMGNPSGAVPPYLILSEVNRRKDMRQRYAGQAALKQPASTVANDIVSALALPPNMGAPGQGAPVPPMQGGIGSPPAPMPPGALSPSGGIAGGPQGYARGGIVGYADGGVPMVDQAPMDRQALDGMFGSGPAPQASFSGPTTVDYSGIAGQYQQMLQREEADRARAPWLALIDAGGAMAAGQSPNALSNIGTGIQSGLKSYTGAIQGDNTTQGQLAGAQMGVLNAQQAQANEVAKMDPNNPMNQTSGQRDYNYLQSLPADQQDAARSFLQPFAQQKAASQKDQAAQIADAIISGEQPPTTTGLGLSMAGPVRAALAAKGYDLTNNYLKYQADLKNVAALNGPAQTRLRQSISQLEPTLDSAQELADKWDGSGFPPLNSATLLAAKNDPTNPEKQALATNLLAQVDHVTAELGQVYMGGNSPTDAAFKLSGSQLSGNWSRPTFDAAIKQIKSNLALRKASLLQAPSYTDSSGNVTNPGVDGGSAAATGTAPPASAAPVSWSVVNP
jgi:hypothetical protein